MDLIGRLTSELGIDASKAQALAGGLMGGLQQQVGEQLSEGDAQQLGQAIPELDDWKAQAAQQLGGGSGGDFSQVVSGLMGSGGSEGGLGGLASTAASMLGGGGGGGLTGLVGPLLEKLGLSGDMLGKIAPIASQFLQERLPEGLMSKLGPIAPFLKTGESGGGVADAVGSLFGK